MDNLIKKIIEKIDKLLGNDEDRSDEITLLSSTLLDFYAILELKKRNNI